MKILVTGAAGFIGYHLCTQLLAEGHQVVGIDNINDYYDVNIKLGRLSKLGIEDKASQSSTYRGFQFYRIDICEEQRLASLFASEKFEYVVHLAAQAGVRYSIDNPKVYIQSNINGFINILELCREHKPKHLVFASSSSVYGLNSAMPFSATHHTDHPVSLYAATKKSNEMMAHSYAHLFNIPCTGLRFFTVYGPWGRPDMAYFSFTKKIIEGNSIDVFNNGDLMRDFTYIDDIVAGIAAIMMLPAEGQPNFDKANPDPSQSLAPYAIYNIGNHKPVKLIEFINTLENAIGKKAVMDYKPMQPGDVYATYADISGLSDRCGFEPKTNIETGLNRFVEWYKEFYKVE
ncbi:MAG TPA: NAD-dependent epimerase [Flavobacterium sp.]